jgi:hypothetical protein
MRILAAPCPARHRPPESLMVAASGGRMRWKQAQHQEALSKNDRRTLAGELCGEGEGAVDPGLQDRDRGDVPRRHGQRVGTEDHKVRALAGGDAAQLVLATQGPGAVDRVGGQGLFRRDPEIVRS